jgi:hypothetical protein
LPNIINLSSEEKRVYNEGKINYTTRYLQRAISKYSQAPFTDRFKTYGYKPALLWEVAGKEQLRSQNELPQQSQGFVLSAAPLNTTLTDEIPSVDNGEIVNNIIDLGENIDNVSSYNGYFYANGEIIQYDAMEYAITGPTDDGENLVWIKNNLEYQRYFSKLPFNGKMYPTGSLRIFAEPEYALFDDELLIIGIKKHGRGRFGTPVVSHEAGLNEYWLQNSTIKGCVQLTEDYLFNTSEIIDYPDNLSNGVAGKFDDRLPAITDPKNVDTFSTNAIRNGIIKNFRANKYYTENELDYFDTTRVGTLQSSALVFKGPDVPENVRTADFVSYVYKELPEPFKHFGTRLRIIGKVESTNQKSQTPHGAFPVFETISLDVDDPEKNVQIFGGAGGLAFNLNKETNVGYYFEIISLTQDNIDQYTGSNRPKVVSYKILSSPAPSCTNNVVTANVETPMEFFVGQKVLISGLVDKDFPTNTSTPLNGEYVITEINTDKKSFRYAIPTPSKNTVTITAAEGNGQIIAYTIDKFDSRLTSIKAGDKINISGLSNSSFNKQNAIVRSFSRGTGDWFFTIEASDVGSLSAQNGTATYVPLTTTSQTGGTVSVSGLGQNVVSNVYFYKILTVSGGAATASSFERINNEGIVEYTNSVGTFNVGDRIEIETILFSGIVTIKSVNENTITFISVGEDIPKDFFVYAGSFPKNIFTTGTNPDLIGKAIPYKLWSGIANILVDDGKFTGQYRFVGEENPTVYDLSAEYINVGTAKRFFLYINGKQVATVTDTEPLPEYNNMALFVRGTSRCMFENIYAIGANISQNSGVELNAPISQVFGDTELNANKALRKYALNNAIQSTYLSGVGSEEPPRYALYFEEFGTIMREAAYLNIKYDRAFPALYARVMKTFNRLKGYSISGFYAGAYGADFLIFNCTDTNINLDDTTGNYLRIQGITFTQNTTKSLTVDDYYKISSSVTDPINNFDGSLINPLIQKEEYNMILNSRTKYGTNEFTIESPYIQSDDAAENVFAWTLEKITKPKILVGLNTFATFNLQLGDLLKINYKNNEGIDVISDIEKNFVVYNIEYTKDQNGENMTMYLAEA